MPARSFSGITQGMFKDKERRFMQARGNCLDARPMQHGLPASRGRDVGRC